MTTKKVAKKVTTKKSKDENPAWIEFVSAMKTDIEEIKENLSLLSSDLVDAVADGVIRRLMLAAKDGELDLNPKEVFVKDAFTKDAFTEKAQKEQAKDIAPKEVLESQIDLFGSTETKTEPKKELPTVTKEDVLLKLKDVAVEFGMDKCTSILEAFDAKKISDLKVSDYEAFILACDQTYHATNNPQDLNVNTSFL